MDHINLFQTNNEFLSAYNGSDYIEPWVSYTREISGVSYNKSAQPHDYSKDYLTFEFIGNQSGSIGCRHNNVYYSLDNGETWNAFTNNVSVSSGDKMLIKGDVKDTSSDSEGVFIWDDCPTFNVYGNVMSFYDSGNFRSLTSFPDGGSIAFLFRSSTIVSAENLILPATALTDGCYMDMFCGCTGLTTAPELPATTLADGCYIEMFAHCYSLTTAPELPATTLAQSCYQSMFASCTGLTAAPELPATTLAIYCYYDMFYACTNLNYIECLATDISAGLCTSQWVYGVASTGTFVKNPNMSSWTTGINGIPTNWTVQDAS